MAWLKVDQDLRDHRKLLEAADILDIEPVHLMGHLISLWLWSLSNVQDGNIGKLTKKTIGRAAQWNGDPEDFISALIEKRLLDQTEEGLFIHDWDDYAGALIRKQEEDRERARKNREKKKLSSDSSRSVRESFADESKTFDVEKNRVDKNRSDKNIRESNGGAPSCDEDISFDSTCNQMPENDRFERFWSAYPRKTGKKEAIEAWKRINPDEDMTETIIAGLERWKQSKQWTDDNGQYIPYPASFLSKERWNDECQPAIDKKAPAAKNYDDDEDFLGTGGASP
jgi:hypothetical protein